MNMQKKIILSFLILTLFGGSSYLISKSLEKKDQQDIQRSIDNFLNIKTKKEINQQNNQQKKMISTCLIIITIIIFSILSGIIICQYSDNHKNQKPAPTITEIKDNFELQVIDKPQQPESTKPNNITDNHPINPKNNNEEKNLHFQYNGFELKILFCPSSWDTDDFFKQLWKLDITSQKNLFNFYKNAEEHEPQIKIFFNYLVEIIKIFKTSLFKKVNPEIIKTTKLFNQIITIENDNIAFQDLNINPNKVINNKVENLNKKTISENNFLPYFKQLMKKNTIFSPAFFKHFYFFYFFFNILKEDLKIFLTNCHPDLLPKFQKYSQQIEKFLK